MAAAAPVHPHLAAGDEHVLVCHRRWARTIRPFYTLAAVIFALIALLQLIRIAMGWSITSNGVDVPFWASWIAIAVAGALSFVGFRTVHRHAQLKAGGARPGRLYAKKSAFRLCRLARLVGFLDLGLERLQALVDLCENRLQV